MYASLSTSSFSKAVCACVCVCECVSNFPKSWTLKVFSMSSCFIKLFTCWPWFSVTTTAASLVVLTGERKNVFICETITPYLHRNYGSQLLVLSTDRPPDCVCAKSVSPLFQDKNDIMFVYYETPNNKVTWYNTWYEDLIHWGGIFSNLLIACLESHFSMNLTIENIYIEWECVSTRNIFYMISLHFQ